MEPLVVVIDLQGPMVESKDLLHLDAILGAIKVRQVRAQLGDDINPRDYHYDLPLERYTSPSGDWVFKASAFKQQRDIAPQMWMQTGKIGLSEAARHRQEGWLSLRASKPVLGGGPFKRSVFHESLVSGQLTAFCIGDKAGVEALLADCTQIGGRRGTGFGRVKSISVTPVAADQCLWHYRALPVDAECALEGHVLSTAALQAPYWDRTLHRAVLVPTD